jgi:hypothetical protein
MTESLGTVLDKMCLDPSLNKFYMDHFASKDEKQIIQDEAKIFGSKLDEDITTKCYVTGAAIRFAVSGSNSNWDEIGASEKDQKDVHLNDLPIFQIQFGGGDHWITICDKKIYHSWWKKFTLKYETTLSTLSMDSIQKWAMTYGVDCSEMLIFVPQKLSPTFDSWKNERGK